MRSIFLIIIMMMNIQSNGQNIQVKALIQDNNNKPLASANICLFETESSDSSRYTTDNDGYVKFSVPRSGKYKLRIAYLGYEERILSFELTSLETQKDLGIISLQPQVNTLSAITIESQKVQIKEDTITYLIDSTMYRKNDNVETMLKNLPGVQVDKDGTVTAQGKQVTRVKVNGKEFFNGDVTTATRELNADMVDRIQIIDDYGDQAAFTGIKDGDPSKTLNIQLKKDKNKGYFGNITTGAGTADRYLNSVSINRFNNDQQISFIGNLNNTNASTFNFNQGGGNIGNMAAGMAKSMGIGRGGGGVGALIGNTGNGDGVSKTASMGLNYRDDWGNKISAYGSYSFSDRNTDLVKSSVQQTLLKDRFASFSQQTNQENQSRTHRASFNIEFKIDSMNYLKINPGVTISENQSELASFFDNSVDQRKISYGNMIDSTSSKNPNANVNIIYNHRFKKRGRTISFSGSAGRNQTESNEDYDNISSNILPFDTIYNRQLQYITQDNLTNNLNGKISYTEPLNKKNNLELNYSYSLQNIENDRSNYLVDTVTGSRTFNNSLSNIYENRFETNRLGINWKNTQKKYNYSVGLSVQPSIIQTISITGNSTFRNQMVNFFPVFRFAYNFSKSRSFNLNYNGNTNQPTNAQLQPVKDSSNPQFITIGNPNLRPEFTNTLSMRYNNFDFVTGNVFFGNITASFTQDKVVNSVKLLRGGAQETTYENSNGYFTIFGFYNVSKPIKNRKYVFNLGGNIGFNNNVSLLRDSLNGSVRNIGKNWIIGQRFSTDIRIKKWLEITNSVNYSLNSNTNSIQKDLNSTSVTWTFSSTARVFLPKDFIFSYDLDQQLNYGFAAGATANPFIINTTLEKQFLKKKNLSVKLQGFDLLNQNIGINRSVNSNGFTDSRSNRLGRYFLLSVVIRLNKFIGDIQNQSMPGMPKGNGGGNPMRMF